MVTSRTYHALHLDIASYPSERIFGPLIERIEKAIKAILMTQEIP